MDQNYRKFSTPPSQRCQRNNEDLANHTSNLIPSYSKRLWWIGVDIEMVSTLIAFFIQKFVKKYPFTVYEKIWFIAKLLCR